MNIFIDESGNFIHSLNVKAWSVVGALAIPEDSLTEAYLLLKEFKENAKAPSNKEAKDRSTYEEGSIKKLASSLGRINCSLYCIALYGGPDSESDVDALKKQKIEALRIGNKNSSIEEIQLAEKTIKTIEKLSPQLYFQAIAHISLIKQFISKGITHYALHAPEELSSFTWRIDRKNKQKKMPFEEIIEAMVTGSIQEQSREEPSPRVVGRNYSYVDKYLIPAPEDSPFPKDSPYANAGGWDLIRIVHEDYKLENSEDSEGIQLADILVSSVRRCLRDSFDDSESVAESLGGLMIESHLKEPCLRVFNFGKSPSSIGRAEEILNCFNLTAQLAVKVR
ncbi:DUF3800 domain-containing protein [Pseudomonas syringae]|uniref:DUF3800 domain-containing protein n=1 Tax=Pseudomonas syringae TaxID=317 RepID=UPI00200B0D3A|nr:DUF3800 domain-containing protein [Pseudomonas syringae]MCK9744988.1 DUF3800 domain-containing protein [Pseudomonas syringae pv. syringae]MCK9767279.1 DUF3800 domain-containing protein [Pseudomonas syringae pv. syringae]